MEFKADQLSTFKKKYFETPNAVPTVLMKPCDYPAETVHHRLKDPDCRLMSYSGFNCPWLCSLFLTPTGILLPLPRWPRDQELMPHAWRPFCRGELLKEHAVSPVPFDRFSAVSGPSRCVLLLSFVRPDSLVCLLVKLSNFSVLL